MAAYTDGNAHRYCRRDGDADRFSNAHRLAYTDGDAHSSREYANLPCQLDCLLSRHGHCRSYGRPFTYIVRDGNRRIGARR
jgi:hypothetical protein